MEGFSSVELADGQTDMLVTWMRTQTNLPWAVGIAKWHEDPLLDPDINCSIRQGKCTKASLFALF